MWEERETDVDENERERGRTKGERKKRPNKVERGKGIVKIVGCGFIEAKKTDQANTYVPNCVQIAKCEIMIRLDLIRLTLLIPHQGNCFVAATQETNRRTKPCILYIHELT